MASYQPYRELSINEVFSLSIEKAKSVIARVIITLNNVLLSFNLVVLELIMITTTHPLRIGLRQERVVTPQCLVIFGASGDLTSRKLLPALFELFKQRRLPSEFALLGCARRPWSDNQFREKMAISLIHPKFQC